MLFSLTLFWSDGCVWLNRLLLVSVLLKKRLPFPLNYHFLTGTQQNSATYIENVNVNRSREYFARVTIEKYLALVLK